jgi:hypothetical protein
MYRRNAAGFAVVHRLLDGCWQDYPVIVDGDEAQEAKKTNAWEKKVTKFMKKLWPKVKDADRRNMVGRYSALLLQVKDNRNGSGSRYCFVKRLGESALVKLIPVWEPQLTVAEWDNDRQSETFGQPKMFNFNEQPVGDEPLSARCAENRYTRAALSCSAKALKTTTCCPVSRCWRLDTTKASTLRRFPAVALRAS